MPRLRRVIKDFEAKEDNFGGGDFTDCDIFRGNRDLFSEYDGSLVIPGGYSI